jgi:hypothetical protein
MTVTYIQTKGQMDQGIQDNRRISNSEINVMERIGERTALRPTKTFYCDGIRKLVDN